MADQEPKTAYERDSYVGSTMTWSMSIRVVRGKTDRLRVSIVVSMKNARVWLTD